MHLPAGLLSCFPAGFYSYVKKYKKVRHTLIRNGKNIGHFNSDLIYIKDVPHIVLEWLVFPNGDEIPAVSVALDSSKLHPLDWTDVQYLYEFPVEWPDKVS